MLKSDSLCINFANILLWMCKLPVLPGSPLSPGLPGRPIPVGPGGPARVKKPTLRLTTSAPFFYDSVDTTFLFYWHKNFNIEFLRQKHCKNLQLAVTWEQRFIGH